MFPPALAAALMVPAVLAAPKADTPLDSGTSVPDPTAIACDGWVYVFGTGPGVVVRRSRDLWNWEDAGAVFDRRVPGWAERAVPGAAGVWAPDITCQNGLYHLYYSVSTLGSQRSAIGLAVTRSLERKGRINAWEDRGPIVESYPEVSNFNAIDPALVVEPNGRWWLFFGSWWTGIKAVRLDPETGKPALGSGILSIAARAPGAQPSIEGAYVVHREGHWYLFVSWGTILPPREATYEVRVGRSRSVEGPYVDWTGKPMLEGGGSRVLSSHDPWRAPGHNGVLHFNGRDWMFHHTFDLRNLGVGRILQVRPIYWIGGWPVVGEPVGGPVAGASAAGPDAAALRGRWCHSVEYGRGRIIELLADGTIAPPGSSASWSWEGGMLTLRWPAPNAPGGSWLDRVRVEPGARSYIGRNQKGLVIRGIREP